MRMMIVVASTVALTLPFGRAGVGLKEVQGNTVDHPSSDRQTRAVPNATNFFLASLSGEQRQKIQYAFTPQKLGGNAPFHRTADGGVAPGAPAGGQPTGAGGSEVGGPGGSGGAASGPPGGFIGEQYGQAVWSNGPGQAGKQIQPEGLKTSEMDAKQRAMLLNVTSQWVRIVNDAYAKVRMAEIEADLNETYFAWSGPLTHEAGKIGSSYYRIQGPRLVIEFSPQGVGGDPTMHVHTIYRDPTNDYGVKLTGAK